MYGADGAVPGVYVPNMSANDMDRWKAKHIKGKDERVEIRKTVDYHTQMVVTVHKFSSWDIGSHYVEMSANGRLRFSPKDWQDLFLAVEEAKTMMGI